jgi:hypothetical protein
MLAIYDDTTEKIVRPTVNIHKWITLRLHTNTSVLLVTLHPILSRRGIRFDLIKVNIESAIILEVLKLSHKEYRMYPKLCR